jgi:hypothetical protein
MNITIPLTWLTQLNWWVWSAKCQMASAQASIYRSPSSSPLVPSQQITVKTDASNYAIASILSIVGNNGKIHLVVFQS